MNVTTISKSKSGIGESEGIETSATPNSALVGKSILWYWLQSCSMDKILRKPLEPKNMTKKFMQASIGIFFLILSVSSLYLLIIYKGQADRQNEILDVSSETLSKWREIGYGILARTLESADMLSPTESNKIVGQVIDELAEMDPRLGTFATSVNNAYLESLRVDKNNLINQATGNSCQYAFDDECDEPNLCPVGTDTSDCR